MGQIQQRQGCFTSRTWSKRREEVVFLALLLIPAFVIRLRNLNSPLTGSYTFRNTQTAWGIRSVAEGVLSPFSVETPVLGPPWRIPFEFPLFQIIAGLFSRLTGLSVEVSGRLTALTFFITSAVFFYLILKKFFDNKVCYVILFLYLFNSHNLEYGSTVLIEFCAVCFSLAAFWLAIKYFESYKNKFLILFIPTASVAALVKITTSIIWIIFGAFALAFVLRPKVRLIFRIFLSGLIAHIPALIWTNWADFQKSKSPMTLWLTSTNLRTWNFGTLRQRLLYLDWNRTISKEFLPSVVGVTVLAIGLVFIALAFSGQRRIPVVFCLLFLSGPFVFTNLYFVHDYYWTAVLPAFLIVIAASLDALDDLAKTFYAKTQIFVFQSLLVLGLVVASWFSTYGTDHFNVFVKPGSISYSSNLEAAVSSIKKFTNIDDKIIVIGADWDPQILYFVNRRGLMIPDGWDAEKVIEKTELGTLYSYVFWYSGEKIDEQTVRSVVGNAAIEMVDFNLFKFISG